jgi:hypothetical protein
MKRPFLLFGMIFVMALSGCGSQEKVTKPETLAPPPDKSSQKGDMAPGPP